MILSNLESIPGKKIIEHGGGWVGFRTTLHREIEENRTLIILTNNSCKVYGAIKKALIDILHNRKHVLPESTE